MNQTGTRSLARGVHVTPRLPDLTFDDALAWDRWVGDDPALTAFWNGLGVAAGAAEAAFIVAARWMLERIDDPTVAGETSAFIQQEAFHATVHARMNRVLGEHGLPVDALRQLTQDLFGDIDALGGRSAYLAAGLSAEQVIGVFGHLILGRTDGMEGAEGPARDLWMWHWFEEVEHSAAFFEGWSHVHGVSPNARNLRLLGMAYILVLLVALLPAATWSMARGLGRDRWRLSTWRALGRQLFGPEGLLRGLGGNLRAFARVDFHPFDLHDPVPLLDRWRDRLTREGWERPVRAVTLGQAGGLDVQPVGWRQIWALVRFSVKTMGRTVRFLRTAG